MPNGIYKTTKERLTSLEVKVTDTQTEVKDLHGKLDIILTNELPHLEKAISEVGWKIGVIVGGASMLGASLVPEVVKLLLNLK